MMPKQNVAAADSLTGRSTYRFGDVVRTTTHDEREAHRKSLASRREP